MSSSLRRSQRKKRGYRCGDIVEVLNGRSLRTGKLIRKAFATSVKANTRWIVSIISLDGEEEGNGLEVCEKSLGAVVEEGPSVTDDSSVSVAPSLAAPSSKTTAATAIESADSATAGGHLHEHEPIATMEAESSKVRVSPTTRASTRRYSSRATTANEAGPKASVATSRPNAEEIKNEAIPKTMKKKPGRKKKVDLNKISSPEETASISASIAAHTQTTKGRVGRKKRSLLPSGTLVENEGTTNKKSKTSPSDGTDSPTSVTEVSFLPALPPPPPPPTGKGRKRATSNAGGHRAVTRALSKTSDKPTLVANGTPKIAQPPATLATANVDASAKKTPVAKPGRGGRRGPNPPGRPRKTGPKKRGGPAVKAASAGAAKRRINANGEYVETVKMLTGTLYLYRGECRRVEFVRTA